jgi:hypothetical protein
MISITPALAATCLALASFASNAQAPAPGDPPTHPAIGSDATSTPSPTTPPTHPAGGTSGATPEAARQQSPSGSGAAGSAAASGQPTPAPGSDVGRSRANTDPKAKGPRSTSPAAEPK